MGTGQTDAERVFWYSMGAERHDWTRQTANAKHVMSFGEALGRAVFVVSTLLLIRPFLSLLYAFKCDCPREEMRTVPLYVPRFLRCLAYSVTRQKPTQQKTGTHFPHSTNI